jgi:hypothetical protein
VLEEVDEAIAQLRWTGHIPSFMNINVRVITEKQFSSTDKSETLWTPQWHSMSRVQDSKYECYRGVGQIEEALLTIEDV